MDPLKALSDREARIVARRLVAAEAVRYFALKIIMSLPGVASGPGSPKYCGAQRFTGTGHAVCVAPPCHDDVSGSAHVDARGETWLGGCPECGATDGKSCRGPGHDRAAIERHVERVKRIYRAWLKAGAAAEQCGPLCAMPAGHDGDCDDGQES